MTYKFAVERQNYADYASGKVFYNLPGHPAFPIRLASEIFQRCLHIRSARGLDAPVTLYDPCCGGAYHLAVLAYLHWDNIREIIASDVNPRTLETAQHNLELLTPPGLERRIAEIETMQRDYGKDSHREARQSAEALKRSLLQHYASHPIPTGTFQANALDSAALRAGLQDGRPDLVISDVPYGIHSQWEFPGHAAQQEPLTLLLENLRDVLADAALVVIASTKEQKIAHAGYRQVGKLKTGKRQVVVLEKN